jgi:hypothetical protein
MMTCNQTDRTQFRPDPCRWTVPLKSDIYVPVHKILVNIHQVICAELYCHLGAIAATMKWGGGGGHDQGEA